MPFNLSQAIAKPEAGLFQRLIARVGNRPLEPLTERQTTMALDELIRTGKTHIAPAFDSGSVAMSRETAVGVLAAARMDASVAPIGRRLLRHAGLDNASSVAVFADGTPNEAWSVRALLTKLMAQNQTDYARIQRVADKADMADRAKLVRPTPIQDGIIAPNSSRVSIDAFGGRPAPASTRVVSGYPNGAISGTAEPQRVLVGNPAAYPDRAIGFGG